MLTIQIRENINARQGSTSAVNRNSEIRAGITDMPFVGQSLLRNLNTAANSDIKLNESGGETNVDNEFTGSITAVVTQVLPNGHLVVVGDKQVGVNQNVDVLQFSGTVDPRTIRPGNTVQSTQVANVRVLSRGRGAQALSLIHI